MKQVKRPRSRRTGVDFKAGTPSTNSVKPTQSAGQGSRRGASRSSSLRRDVGRQEPHRPRNIQGTNPRTGGHFFTGAVYDSFAAYVLTGYEFIVYHCVLPDYVLASAFPFALDVLRLQDVNLPWRSGTQGTSGCSFFASLAACGCQLQFQFLSRLKCARAKAPRGSC